MGGEAASEARGDPAPRKRARTPALPPRRPRARPAPRPWATPTDGRRLQQIQHVGSGNFGVAKLMRDKQTGQQVVLKFLERGEGIDKNVEREIVNMRTMRHPNIIRFYEVLLTPTHLCVVMEYAAGGELFEHIVNAGRFSENQARYYFQQLICGLEYCHRRNVCHRDLKLENTLLDCVPTRTTPPKVKICDFGYSKSDLLHSQPKSTVGTPAYIAPEVLQRKEYSGYQADVWSCGVTLYVMLVGAYPFEDTEDPKNFRKTIQRIMAVKYAFPTGAEISESCRDLLSRIFVGQPQQRITVQGIKAHPWFLQALPNELALNSYEGYGGPDKQSEEEVRRILQEAKTPAAGQGRPGGAGDTYDDDLDMDDYAGSGQFDSGEF